MAPLTERLYGQRVRSNGFVATVLVGLLVWAAPAFASDLAVTSTVDTHDASPGDGACADASSTCTLRAAIEEAAAMPGADRVLLPAGHYTLSAGGLTIASDLTIAGDDARTTVIDGNQQFRPVTILSGTVELDGMTVTGGDSGGISMASSAVTLDHLAVTANVMSGAPGGGISEQSGTLMLRDSAVTRNTAMGGGGSGQVLGGGIFAGGALSAVRTTIANNTAYDGWGTTYGGGIYATAPVSLDHVTLAANSATTGPGLATGAGATVLLANSILADGCDLQADATEIGTNLDATGTSCRLGASSLNGVDPQLGALTSHGGQTETLLPAVGSPVLDAASTCGAIAGDQRGLPTPAGPACDLGAVELGSDLAVTLTASAPWPMAVIATYPVSYTARVQNLGRDSADPVTLVFQLPPGVPAWWSPPGTGVRWAETTAGDCTSTAAAVTCSISLFPFARPYPVQIRFWAPFSSQATLTATVSSATPEIAPQDNTTSVTFPIGPAPPPGLGGWPGSTGLDRTPPVLSRPHLHGRLTLRSGGWLRVTLSEPATVWATIFQRRGGHEKQVGRVQRDRGAGLGALPLPHRGLRAGPCTIRITAMDGTFNHAKPVVLHARVWHR
jgi:CSLREA domain-containing protein